jgi:RNA polymerase sigma-70 factor (sigma-E family)
MRAQDERRFEEVVAARYDQLRRTAVVLCGDPHHAEDLVQTVFMRLHRSWRRVDGVQDLDAYLHVMLVNASRSWWRRRWHGEVPLPQLPETVDTLGAGDGVDLRHTLVAALATLTPSHREVLVLRYLAGLSETETAAALGCSTGTVKSRASRATAALRQSGLLDDSTARTT